MASLYQSGSSARDPQAGGAVDRLAFDNLLRRELKVTDPNDARQVAQALLTRYKDDPRAAAMDQEARGLPFALGMAAPAPVPLAPVASDGEWQEARGDVERDLEELTHSVELKDTSFELTGWAQGIRTALAEGIGAARFGLDPRQRDKVFGIRAQLRDYARLSRLLGALTQASTGPFRQLARSLDETAGVLLVRLGESLATTGYGGRFLLQAPFSELQVRRDACIYALRNLIGSAQESYGQNEWPRGLDAYRRLYELLETEGQGDLRALLVEGELARSMDELVQRSGQGTPEGLRAVGATAQVDLARFRRLVSIGRNSVHPNSPALAAFLESLQLFIDGFNTAGGSRLLRIARPPILLYGLYGAQGIQDADRRLLDLITVRTTLAEFADCFMDCTCTTDDVKRQIALDKALYSMDRAIDLYALGRNEFEQPECRASAHAYVLIACWLALRGRLIDPARPGGEQVELSPTSNNFEVAENAVSILGLLLQGAADLAPFTLLSVAASNWTPGFQPRFSSGAFSKQPRDAFSALRERELCLQREIEQSWQPMLLGMSSGCVRLSDIFGDGSTLREAGILEQLNQVALRLNDDDRVAFDDATSVSVTLNSHTCEDDTILIPPHFETSLNELVNDTDDIEEILEEEDDDGSDADGSEAPKPPGNQ